MQLGKVLEKKVLHIMGFKRPTAIEGVELAPAQFEGGFGSVHSVLNDEKGVYDGFLFKVINGPQAEESFRTISLLYDKLERLSDETWRFLPGLTALPFQIYRCNVDSEVATVFLMKDLRTLSFEDFGSDDFDEIVYIQELGIEQKLRYAKNFADVFALFESIDFYHSDIKEKSLFVSSKFQVLSVIDYDGGFHGEDERTGTIGSITRYAGRKLLNWLLNKKTVKELDLEERKQDERWPLASALFHLVTGMTPFFFFNDLSDESFKRYSEDYGWPEVDFNDKLFNQDASTLYNYFREWWQWSQGINAFGTFRTLCLRTFGRGLTDENYPTALEWKEAIYELIKEFDIQPVINEFVTDKSEINKKKEEVQLHFDCSGVDYLEIDGEMHSYFTRGLSKKLNDAHVFDALFTLQPHQVHLTREVRANKVDPVIHLFNADRSLRENLDPITLKWQVDHAVAIEIRDVKSNLESQGELEVEPNGWIKYTLVAKGAFDQMAEKAVVVDVVHPKMLSFSSKVNLEKGYRNVDIRWEAEFAESVSIEGIGEKLKPKGIGHIDVIEPFRLKAVVRGFFGQEVEESILVEPFPQPVIKSLFVPTPDMSSTWSLNIPDFNKSLRATEFELSNLPELNLKSFEFGSFELDFSDFELIQQPLFDFDDIKTFQSHSDETT